MLWQRKGSDQEDGFCSHCWHKGTNGLFECSKGSWVISDQWKLFSHPTTALKSISLSSTDHPVYSFATLPPCNHKPLDCILFYYFTRELSSFLINNKNISSRKEMAWWKRILLPSICRQVPIWHMCQELPCSPRTYEQFTPAVLDQNRHEIPTLAGCFRCSLKRTVVK